jgi:hypothetical protein
MQLLAVHALGGLHQSFLPFPPAHELDKGKPPLLLHIDAINGAVLLEQLPQVLLRGGGRQVAHIQTRARHL